MALLLRVHAALPFGCVLQNRKPVKLGPENSGSVFGGDWRLGGPELQTKQANMFAMGALEISCASKKSSSSRRNLSGCLPEVSAIELFFAALPEK